MSAEPDGTDIPVRRGLGVVGLGPGHGGKGHGVKYLVAGLLLVGWAAPILADEPQWLTDARAKEGKLSAPHTETNADQQVSFAVPVPVSAPLSEDKTFDPDTR